MKLLIPFLVVLLPVSVLAELKLSPRVDFSLTQPSDSLVKRKALSVEVGDSTKATFNSSFTVGAWGDECFFKVHFAPALAILQNDIDTSLLVGKPQLTADYGGDGIHRFYVTSDSNFEWEITFNAMPDTNVFSFDIETEGLRFYYQPPLTQQQIDSGVERSDSVEYSYAVYHNSKSHNWNLGNGTRAEYKTGKAFHLYRPRIIDNVKKTAWCSFDVDTILSKLTLTIPQQFLDGAIFPVVVGPTIGKTDIGGSESYWSEYILVVNFVDAGTGLTDATFDYGYWYNRKSNAICDQSTFRCYVYVQKGDTACGNSEVRDSTSIGNGSPTTTPQWDSVAFSGANAYGDSTYMVSYKAAGWFMGGLEASCKRTYFDTEINGNTKTVSTPDFDAEPTLSGCDWNDKVYSCYASFSVSAVAVGHVIFINE